MRNTVFLLILPFLISTNAFAQEIPEEFYVGSQVYDNKISNDQILLSSDKSIYNPGEDGILLGIVFDTGIGDRVFITIFAPDGSVVSEINVAPKNDGTFKVQQQIPIESVPGKYTIEAKYTQQGNPVSLIVELSDLDPTTTNLVIPFNSANEDSGLNFSPQNVKIKSNEKLVWLNNDISVHTVVSGTIGFNNKMFSDGKFDSGIISPDNTFELYLEAGEYNYFCRLHPWLRGNIVVSHSDEPFIPPSDPTPEKTESTDQILLNSADTIDSWTLTPCINCISNITLSSDNKEGLASVVLSVLGNQDSTGPRSSFDLELEPLDISEMESLSLWIKTKGSTLGKSQIVLIDSMGNSRVLKMFLATSFPQWTKLNLYLDEFDSEVSGFNENSVAELSIRSPWGALMKTQQLEIFLDDIKWTKQIVSFDEPELKFLTISTNKDVYYTPESIPVSGQITFRESDLPVTIQVFNMQQELVQIEQIVPNKDNTFNFTISTTGKQFQKEGVYNIKAVLKKNVFQVNFPSIIAFNPINAKITKGIAIKIL